MVRLADPVAINRDGSALDSQIGETAEVLERRIQAEYDKALEQERSGNKAEAQALFKQLLAEPALQDVTSGTVTTLAHARYLVLKNLAGSLVQDDATCKEALQFYIEASELDCNDTVLWQRLGSLASELGQWSLARHALESGLRCSPQHYVIQSRLLEVLLALADWQSISALLCIMLQQNSANLRAAKVFSTLQDQQHPSQQKRLLLSEGSVQQDELTLLQPQLKRRCVSPPEKIPHLHQPEHCIVLQRLTWQHLISTVCSHLADAASKGLPGASKVVFTLPEAESPASEVDMMPSPPAAEATTSQAAVPSLQLSLTESDDAARQESANDTEGEDKPKAEVVPAVPQRASKRLGSSRAVTEVASDHESPESAKHVVELLAPFLAAQPSDVCSQPALYADTATDSAELSAAEAPLAEQSQVQEFISQQQAKGGLYAVASGLLESLLRTGFRSLSSAVVEGLLTLEATVQGWHRSAIVALTLAELYYQVLIKAEPSQAPSKGKKSVKQSSASPSSNRPDQLLASCTANMGIFEAALLLQEQAAAPAPHLHQSPPDSLPAPGLTLDLSSQDNMAALSPPENSVSRSHAGDVYQLLARYHWLGGCLSQHLKQYEDASRQYEACHAALTAVSSRSDTAQAISFTSASGVTIAPAIVESRLEALKIVMMVEDGRRCLDEGQHEELVARLSPVLLSGTTSQLPLDVPQQLAGLDLIKEAASGPTTWQTQLQCLLAAASLQLPACPAPTASQQTQAPRVMLSAAALTIITNLAEELQKQLAAWEKNVQADGYSQAVGLGHLLARVQWQLLGLVQGLYACLATTASSSPPRRSLDVKDQLQQKGLLQVLQLLLTLRKLDSSIPHGPQSQLQLLGTGVSLLVDAGILGLSGGMFLHTCLKALAPYFTECARFVDRLAEDADTDDDETCKGLLGAAAQCIYLLYGLDLTERDEQWTDGFQGKVDSPDPQSQEAAVLLWNYLVHFCGSLTNRSKSFKSRLKELLTAILAQVPPPPDAVLAHFDLDALLDSAASAIPGSTSSTVSSEAAVPHQQAPMRPLSESNTLTATSAATEAASAVLNKKALAEAVRQDPDVSLHAELYHMLAQCEPDVFEHLTPDDLIKQQGHEQIVEYLQLTRFDLCYHPWRYESWERVLNVYASAGSTLSNTAVDIGKTADQWWPSDLQHRYSLYCQRALATIHYAQLAAAKLTDEKERANTLAFLEEQKGTLFLEQVQNAPPLYNQMHNSPRSVDPQYRHKCAAGLQAFQRAQLTLNEEWEFQLCIAKFLRKLGGNDEQVLHHLAKACHLAKEFADGTVESMYQLHATRLKLLQQPQPCLALLQRYCFLPETRAQLASTTDTAQSSQDQSVMAAEAAQLTADGNVEMTDEGRWELIFQDAMSAMEYCLEQSKPSRGGQHETFHKARYRRAQALFWQGKPGPALAELQPCFKIRSRHGFTINMFVIPEGVKRASKAYAASEDVEMAEETETSQAKPSVPEELWGQKIDSLSNNGVEETTRKFCAHVRRALILYVLLLKDIGDLDTLRGVVSVLRGSTFGSYSDLCRWAFGMYVIHLAAALQQVHLPTTDSAQIADSLQHQQRGVTSAAAHCQAGSLHPDNRIIQHTSDGRLPQVLPKPASSQDPVTAPAGSTVLEPAPPTAAADVELLEKAYQVYQESCLSSDTPTCWDQEVQPALHAALTFHAPNTTDLLGDAAISPEMFHKYAQAYIHSLGISGNLDKLQEIQKRVKRQMSSRKAAAEACQSLLTAATAAEQAALDSKLDQLESQVHEALQSNSMPANDAAAGEPMEQAPVQPAAGEAAALDEFSGIQSAEIPQIDAQAQPAEPAEQGKTAQASDQPEAMQLAGQPQCMQGPEPVPAPAASADIPHKELLLTLLAVVKRCHSMWKATGAKSDAVQGSGNKAVSQMSRAYLAYLHLGWPGKIAPAMQRAAATSAIERLLQQTRAGVLIPEPTEQLL